MVTLLNPRTWLALGATIVLAVIVGVIYRAGGDSARADLAEFKAAQAEAGRLAMQQREREQAAIREREATWQDQFDKGARDGRKAREVALADAGRAQSALERVRRENAALRTAIRSAAAGAGAAPAGLPAGSPAGVPADMLDRLRDRVERLGARAGVYARFADLSHAVGTTCQRNVDARTAPLGVSLFSPLPGAPRYGRAHPTTKGSPIPDTAAQLGLPAGVTKPAFGYPFSALYGARGLFELMRAHGAKSNGRGRCVEFRNWAAIEAALRAAIELDAAGRPLAA